MNCLILCENDFLSANKVQINDRRAEHIVTVLKSQIGDTLTCGVLNGHLGQASISNISQQKNPRSYCVELIAEVSSWTQLPPEPQHIRLFLALPRPNMFKRILRHITELGIKEVHFFASEKVEKSFWQSPVLSEESIHENLLLGLEQSCDTQLPKIVMHRQARQFLRTALSQLSTNPIKLIAHPYQAQPCPVNIQDSIDLIIGPEGGFSKNEVQQCLDAGFESVHIGPRILRVENAVTALISRLANF